MDSVDDYIMLCENSNGRGRFASAYDPTYTTQSNKQKKNERKKKGGNTAPKAAPSKPSPVAKSPPVVQQKRPQVIPLTPQQKIDAVRECYEKYAEMVLSFAGSQKEYVYLEEMLEQQILKLDDVAAGSKEEVRLNRKKLIKDIQSSIIELEKKNPAKANVQQQGSQSVATAIESVQHRLENAAAPIPQQKTEAQIIQQKTDVGRALYEKINERVQYFTGDPEEYSCLLEEIEQLVLKFDNIVDEANQEARADRDNLITDIEFTLAQLEQKNPAKYTLEQQESETASSYCTLS